jgi:hypothetical protein
VDSWHPRAGTHIIYIKDSWGSTVAEKVFQSFPYLTSGTHSGHKYPGGRRVSLVRSQRRPLTPALQTLSHTWSLLWAQRHSFVLPTETSASPPSSLLGIENHNFSCLESHIFSLCSYLSFLLSVWFCLSVCFCLIHRPPKKWGRGKVFFPLK